MANRLLDLAQRYGAGTNGYVLLQKAVTALDAVTADAAFSSLAAGTQTAVTAFNTASTTQGNSAPEVRGA